MTSGCSVLHFNIKYPDVMVNGSTEAFGSSRYFSNTLLLKNILKYLPFSSEHDNFFSQHESVS